MKFCTKCGAKQGTGAKFCTVCGAPRGTSAPSGRSASRTATAQPAPTKPSALRVPAMLLTLATAFTGHFYVMGFVHDGIERATKSDGSLGTNRFVMPKFAVQDNDTRASLRTWEQRIGNVVNPLLPMSGHLVNWKQNLPGTPSDERVATKDKDFETFSIARRVQGSFFNGNFKSSFAIWTAGSAVFWSLFWTLLQRGPVAAVGSVFGRPFQLLGWITRCRGRDWGALLIGAGVTLLLHQWLGLSRAATFVLGLSSMMLTTTPGGARVARGLFRLVPGGWKGERSRSRFSLRSATLMLAGVGPALIAARVFVPAPTGKPHATAIERATEYLCRADHLMYAGLACLGIGVLVYLSKGMRTVMRRTAVLWPILIYFFHDGFIGTGLADDGGATEFGGSVGDWLGTQQAVETAIHSTTAVLGTALGPLTPGMTPQELPDESQQTNELTSISVSVGPARFDN